MLEKEKKRLFLALAVDAPWPEKLPKGRIIEENSRHVTLAFLGNCLMPDMGNFPEPKFSIGPIGRSDEILFLPKKKPRVASHHIEWVGDGKKMEKFHQDILDWLEGQGYPVDRRPFLPHLTFARAPFSTEEWQEHFEPLPIIVTGVHLCESIGNLRYPSIWSFPLLPPFEEFEHTADIAFHVRGENFFELYLHGAWAMGFKFPQFLDFVDTSPIDSLDKVVQRLNQMIAKCDQEHGCPFKAVSYHGKMDKEESRMLWDMVVDV